MQIMRKHKTSIRKYVLFGDTQFHPWQETENYERWRLMLNVIGDVFYTAKDIGAKAVIHMGDLFESKRAVRTDVLVSVTEALREAIDATGLPLTLICGNHDMYNGKVLPSILSMDGVQVIHNVDWAVIDERHRIYAVPYGGHPINALRYRVLLCHTDIRKCSYGGARCTETSLIDEAVLQAKHGRLAVLNGHYHHPQEVSLGKGYVPVTCVGSPYHINWSDLDSPVRGCVVLTSCMEDGDGHVRIKRKQLHGYPRFLSTAENARQGFDFVRIVGLELEDGSTTVRHEDSETIGGDNIEDSLRGYVAATVSDPKRRKRLTRLGLSLYHS